jgi:hypothetical protein
MNELIKGTTVKLVLGMVQCKEMYTNGVQNIKLLKNEISWSV